MLGIVIYRFSTFFGLKLLSMLYYFPDRNVILITLLRVQGLRGLYAGFNPAVIGSTVSWGLYFFL